MSPRPGPPIEKVTIFLFEGDSARMAHIYGYGWSAMIRELVHQHLESVAPIRTIGDQYGQ